MDGAPNEKKTYVRAAVLRPPVSKMKPNDSPESEGRLRELLATWKVAPTLPPRFEQRVWQRIERCETQPAVGALAQWFNQIATALTNPRLAISYMTILLAAGLLAGFWQAQLAKARAAENLSARYVQMLDPYQMPRN